MRLTKGDITYDYYGDLLIKETKQNSYTIEYIHGINGLIGFVYNGTPYYYIKNIFGDVYFIIDRNGNTVAEYEYDAWGKCTIISETGGIGTVNPIRYRSYYYDVETEFYYLQSRYYDPETARFISPDKTDYLEPQSFGGLNLYIYCLDNPVMYADPSGNFAISTFGIMATIGIVLVASALGGLSQLISNALAGETGNELWRGVAGAALGAGANALALCLLPITGVASFAASALISAAVQTGIDTIETLIRGENILIVQTMLDFGINFATAFIGNFLGSSLISTNSGWFKPQKFTSVFTKPYGQKILLQTAIGSVLSAYVNFSRKNNFKDIYVKILNPKKSVSGVPINVYQ